jgi:hypothetical protein
VLRVLAEGQAPNIEAQEILRKSLLEAEKKRRNKVDTNEEILTWKGFLADRQSTDLSTVKSTKKKFGEFLEEIGKVTDEDGSAIGTAARFVFDEVGLRKGATKHFARINCEKVLGKIPQLNWNRLQNMAEELHTWQSQGSAPDKR